MPFGPQVDRALFFALAVLLIAATAGAQEVSSPHVGHVATAFPNAPGGHGLAVTAAREANTAMLHANFAAGDLSSLDAMQTHARHVLHALDPEQQNEGPGLGFGVKQAAEAIVRHIEMGVESEGASEALRTYGPRVAMAGRSVVERAERGVEIIRQVLAAETAQQAGPLVRELQELALQLDTGTGSNLEAGEGGLVHLEAQVYNVLIGERQLRVLR